jgi:dipeptidyl aminopeptidase/acylaminoacyl peptidase
MAKNLALIILITVMLSSCNNQQEEKALESKESKESVIKFFDREIDLEPYFNGFPYRGFVPVMKENLLFYYEMGEKTELKIIPLGTNDLTKGKLVSDIDFAKRNVWGLKYRPEDSSLYWQGDEINDEVINIYRMNINTGEPEKLTDMPYIFGWNWNKDKDKAVYIARLGVKEKREGEIRIIDLNSKQDLAVCKDIPELRYSWCKPSWRPDGSGAVVLALKDAHRNFSNLIYIDFATGKSTLLTDSSLVRKNLSVAGKWINNNQFIYVSDESGYSNLYKYDLGKSQSFKLTNFEKELSGDVVIPEVDGKNLIFCMTASPIENELYLIDPEEGDIVYSQKTKLNLSIVDHEENKIIYSASAGGVKFVMDEITVSKTGFEIKNILDIPDELKSQIIHADIERVEFPTFDIDPNTGKPRMLHGYLYKPKNPLPKDKQKVLVHSFYGGGNYFHNRWHILTQAGLYIFSPSPRGSRGFGREFASLNDSDLGGNEIIDIIYAGRYISEKLDIPPERIGVFGGSHGGYAVMRLLTFPGEINGLKENFDWGFGISHAGFSDITHFYEHCNIPDWVILESGDPATEKEKLDDRSPLYHADKMNGRLLLTHGTNDQRVPVEGSRFMADSLRKYDKDVKLVEFEGQGHVVKGLENNKEFFRLWFEFLEK